MIPESVLCTLPLLNEETVLTEKLDGANCSIYRGSASTASCVFINSWINIIGIYMYTDPHYLRLNIIRLHSLCPFQVIPFWESDIA